MSFPILVDISNIKRTTGVIDKKNLTRRSITLGLSYAYIILEMYKIILLGSADIGKFEELVLFVVGYYFGKSTAEDKQTSNPK
jgi:hypothetical protein